MSGVVEDAFEFVDVKDFTREVTIIDSNGLKTVTGAGVFDVIMDTITKHLSIQFENGRVKGEEYSKAYIQLTAAALDTATKLLVQKPIADKQELLVEAQIESEKAKKALYERQAKGYDDDAKQKILKILLDVWGIAFSVAKDNEDLVIPESINKKSIDSLVRDMLVDSELGKDGTGPIDLFTDPFSGLFK